MPPTQEPEVLARRESTSLARLDPQALIAQAIQTGSGIETMERLVALAREVRADQAREAWYDAMAEFQRQCPAIKKTASAEIRTKSGAKFTYKFAPLDEITSTIQPVMGPLGLSVSWRSAIEADRVVVSCRISHTLGHHEDSGDVAMPIETAEVGGSGANPAQRVGIALTYAKRYSLLGIIGMAPEDDDDAKGAGTVAGAAGAAPPPQSEDGSALVTGIETKTGTSKANKPWTMYTITFDDGRSGTTFSESLMTVAHDAKNFGARVVPTLEQKGQYWNLLELVMVEPEAGEAVAFITENNEKRLLAIARGLKPVAWTDDQLHDLLTSKGIGSVKEIPLAEYEAIIDAIKAGPKK